MQECNEVRMHSNRKDRLRDSLRRPGSSFTAEDASTVIGICVGLLIVLEQFRNYCGLKKIARCGFPWEKTTKRPVASVYTNCETALAALVAGITCFSLLIAIVRDWVKHTS